ncbi:MAG: hypothetical protein M1118_08045 [Chloroflexi bacterium]|nr:hypothetical protein [Chloroflexota bacterium]
MGIGLTLGLVSGLTGTPRLLALDLTVVSAATTTQTTTASSTAQAAGGQLSGSELFNLTAIILLFFAAVIVSLLVYLYRVQSKFYAIDETLALAGATPEVQQEGTFVNQRLLRAFAAIEAVTTSDLTIAGPTHVLVTQASQPFTATVNGEAVAVTWSLTPEEAGTLSQTAGTTTAVIAKLAGPFAVVARQHGGGLAIWPVVAVAGAQRRPRLPWVGDGFGTILIGALLLVTVLILGLRGTLDGGAIATFTGGFLGYIFGIGVPQAIQALKSSDGQSATSSGGSASGSV